MLLDLAMPLLEGEEEDQDNDGTNDEGDNQGHQSKHDPIQAPTNKLRAGLEDLPKLTEAYVRQSDSNNWTIWQTPMTTIELPNGEIIKGAFLADE